MQHRAMGQWQMSEADARMKQRVAVTVGTSGAMRVVMPAQKGIHALPRGLGCTGWMKWMDLWAAR